MEQKDLQMKANTVKRLMEEGYRVKVHLAPQASRILDD